MPRNFTIVEGSNQVKARRKFRREHKGRVIKQMFPVASKFGKKVKSKWGETQKYKVFWTQRKKPGRKRKR